MSMKRLRTCISCLGIWILCWSLGTVFAQNQSGAEQETVSCDAFQKLNEDFLEAYDLNQKDRFFQLCQSIHALSQQCPEFPEDDQFWRVIYMVMTQDSNYQNFNLEMLDVHKANKDSLHLARNLFAYSAVKMQRFEHKGADSLFNEIMAIAKSHKHYPLAGKCAMYQAQNYSMVNQFGLCFEASVEGLKVLKEAPEDLYGKKLVEGNLNLLASYGLLNQGVNEDALSFVNQSVEDFEEFGDKNRVVTAMNQKGVILNALGKPDSAGYYMEKSLSLIDTSSIEGLMNYGRVTFSLAHHWNAQKNYDKALKMAKIAASIDKIHAPEENYYLTQALVGTILVYMQDKAAEPILLEAYDFFAQSKRYDMIRGVSKSIAVYYTQHNRSEEAIKFWEIRDAAQDSLNSEAMAVAMENARVKHKTEQKEELLAIQGEQLEQADQLARIQAGFLWAIGIGLIVALGLGGLALFAFFQKRKGNELLAARNAEIEKQNQEKALLLKEIHHRVKNNLQVVSNLLELQAKGIEDEKALELTREGQNRVKSMALIHQKLYQDEGLDIDFDDYVDKLVKEVRRLYGKDHEVETHITTHGHTFDIDTAIPLGLIINELVTNAFKYGFSSDLGKRLSISLAKEEEGLYTLTVEDNGKGLPADLDLAKTRSLGLRLVRRLTKQLHGKVFQSNENGCIFTIRFKDTQARLLTD